jgi:hypothetical protein
MATRATPINPKKPLEVISTRPYSWLDHAERHFLEGTSIFSHHPDYIDPTKEALMFLCLLAHVGAFSS